MSQFWWSRVAGALLILSGALTVRGSWERWWPTCALGKYESTACFALQDNLHDYLPVAPPWAPVGAAAQWQGVALLFLAAALLCLMPTFGWRSKLRAALQVGLMIVAAAIAYLGVATIWAGVVGEVGHLPFVMGAWRLWAVLGMIVFGAMALHNLAFVSDTPLPSEFRRTTWMLLFLTTPLVFWLFIAPIFVLYASHDTAPWSEAVLGWCLIATGVVTAFGGTMSYPKESAQAIDMRCDRAHI